MSKILLPTDEETAISPHPFLATITLVIKSGTEVPAAKKVNPTTYKNKFRMKKKKKKHKSLRRARVVFKTNTQKKKKKAYFWRHEEGFPHNVRPPDHQIRIYGYPNYAANKRNDEKFPTCAKYFKLLKHNISLKINSFN